MKSFSAASLLLATATAVSAVSSAADLSTISRTSIHTTCPSSAIAKGRYYSNSTIAANIAASPVASSESDVVLYETEIYTKDSTVTLVSTSCSADRCEVTTILESLTTVVTTVDGVLTTYVTGVPITPTTTVAQQAKATAAQKPKFTPAQKPKVTAVAEPSSVVGEDVTVTKPVTTVVTITSCSHDICKKTAVTTGVTVVTAEVDGVKTVYTTYCPLSGESTPTTEAAKKTDVVETSETPVPTAPAPAPVTVTKPATTIVTITSCKENKCEKIPVTTGVSAYSTTINGVVTDYTTYCPLSSETTTETAPAPETPTVQKSSTTPASESTVNVITNNIVTQSKTIAVQSASTSSAVISIYEGAAHRAVPAVLALPALYLLL